MDNFCLTNLVRNISFNQFNNIINKLYFNIKEIRPEIDYKLILEFKKRKNYNLCFFYDENRLPSIIKKNEFEMDLDSFNPAIWPEAENVNFFIQIQKEQYLIHLNSKSFSNKIQFHSKNLDEKSREIFFSFDKKNLLERMDERISKYLKINFSKV